MRKRERNYYKEVINLISKVDVNYKKICLEIAKRYPKRFLKSLGHTPQKSSAKNYCKIIDVLSYNCFDYRNSVIQIAKKYPSIIVNKHDNFIHDNFIHNQIIPLLIKGEKIKAIKLYREEYNIGLKEAKETIDKMY